VPKAQLELALAGRVEFVYGYSFILTDLDGDAAEIELWHRQRGQMEERVKELKLGDGLLRSSAHMRRYAQRRAFTLPVSSLDFDALTAPSPRTRPLPRSARPGR